MLFRAAEHLTGAGVIGAARRGRTVLFAAPRGFIPPARGSVQSGTPLITAALRRRGTVERDHAVVLYRDGSTSDQMYGQAAWCDEDYLIAVSSLNNQRAPVRSATPGYRTHPVGIVVDLRDLRQGVPGHREPV